LGIRPEFVQFLASATQGAVPVEIQSVEDLGNFKILTARLGQEQLMVKISEDMEISPGVGWLAFPPERTRLYADNLAVK